MISDPTLSGRIVDWVGSRRSGDIPPDVTAAVGTAILHHALCGIRGQALETAVSLRRALWDPAGAQVVAVTPEAAAYSGGAFGHLTLQEDMHVPSQCHLGTVVVPTALALASEHGVGGAELVTAIACGYEVAGKVGTVLAQAGLATRARPTGTNGPLGSWAVASRLRRSDANTAARALGLAVNAASGLNTWAWQGGEDVFIHAGQAARAGIEATRLAGAGVGGSLDGIGGKAGFLMAFGDAGAPGRLAAESWPGRDDRWVLQQIVFKRHPACNYVQTVLDVATEVGTAIGPLGAEPPKSIDVWVSTAAALYPGCDAPGPWPARLAAQMSIQFAVAVALSGDDYAQVITADPSMWSELYSGLAARVRVQTDEAIDARYPEQQGARLQVVLADGREIVASHDDLCGLSPAEIRADLRAFGDLLNRPDLVELLVTMSDDLLNCASTAPLTAAVDELWHLAAASSSGTGALAAKALA